MPKPRPGATPLMHSTMDPGGGIDVDDHLLFEPDTLEDLPGESSYDQEL